MILSVKKELQMKQDSDWQNYSAVFVITALSAPMMIKTSVICRLQFDQRHTIYFAPTGICACSMEIYIASWIEREQTRRIKLTWKRRKCASITIYVHVSCDRLMNIRQTFLLPVCLFCWFLFVVVLFNYLFVCLFVFRFQFELMAQPWWVGCLFST